jgi:hypothetical protein
LICVVISLKLLLNFLSSTWYTSTASLSESDWSSSSSVSSSWKSICENVFQIPLWILQVAPEGPPISECFQGENTCWVIWALLAPNLINWLLRRLYVDKNYVITLTQNKHQWRVAKLNLCSYLEWIDHRFPKGQDGYKNIISADLHPVVSNWGKCSEIVPQK